MDIMELGAIGELVGGTAVLATLVYLALQVRQGNKAGSRDSYRTWVSELNKVWFEPLRDPEFMELFQRGNRNWDALSLREQGAVNAVYAPVMLLLQEVYVQRDKGGVDEFLNSQADAVTATFLQMPGPAAWWALNTAFFSPEFYSHTNTLLKAKDCPPPMSQLMPWYAGEEV